MNWNIIEPLVNPQVNKALGRPMPDPSCLEHQSISCSVCLFTFYSWRCVCVVKPTSQRESSTPPPTDGFFLQAGVNILRTERPFASSPPPNRGRPIRVYKQQLACGAQDVNSEWSRKTRKTLASEVK